MSSLLNNGQYYGTLVGIKQPKTDKQPTEICINDAPAGQDPQLHILTVFGGTKKRIPTIGSKVGVATRLQNNDYTVKQDGVDVPKFKAPTEVVTDMWTLRP